MTESLSPQRLAWLTIRRQRGEKVTYTRGDLSIEMVAVATRPETRQIDGGEQFVTQSRELDWLVAPDEMVDEDGTQIEPAKRATITRASGEVYRVMPTDSTEHSWRWSDPTHAWRRIHTQQY